MRRIILALSIIVMVISLAGADFRRNASSNSTAVPEKKKCIGYTILEFGKGIDCNGDTLKLVRINGVQVVAQTIQ